MRKNFTTGIKIYRDFISRTFANVAKLISRLLFKQLSSARSVSSFADMQQICSKGMINRFNKRCPRFIIRKRFLFRSNGFRMSVFIYPSFFPPKWSLKILLLFFAHFSILSFAMPNVGAYLFSLSAADNLYRWGMKNEGSNGKLTESELLCSASVVSQGLI